MEAEEGEEVEQGAALAAAVVEAGPKRPRQRQGWKVEQQNMTRRE